MDRPGGGSASGKEQREVPMGQDRPRDEPGSKTPVSPGALLRATRERLGSSLEAMEEKTRIRRAFLEALEEGRYDRLPGPVYTRAFLKLYANALGLDPRDVLSAYDQAVGRQAAGASATRQPGRPRPWWRPDPVLEALEPKRKFRALAGATLLVVLVAVAAAWLLSLATEPPRRATEETLSGGAPPEAAGGAPPAGEASAGRSALEGHPPEPTRASQPAAAPSRPAPAEGQAASASAAQESARPVPAGGDASRTAELAGSPPGPAPAPEGPSTGVSGPVSLPGATGSGVEVVARVVERSWIEAFADGKEVYSGTAEPGDVLSWRADRFLSVRFGNAEGVELVVNGRPMGRAGRGVVTRHFFASAPETRP